MVSEVSKVLMVLVIILLAFSTALACVGTDQAVFADFGAALKSLSQLMLNLDPPVFDLSSQAAAIFLVAFVLVSVIGVLNILIAQLNETYDRLSDLTRGYATLHRAQIAVELESYLSVRCGCGFILCILYNCCTMQPLI
uniref:Polycystin cation channel PKD1/PKD2 domain-containing protein n=1 Tax=Cryptomonas curvata TaxID=233186 RepID=A0A7S0MRF3_9CRYP